MPFIRDEKFPFICSVSKEYCAGEIQNIDIELESKVIGFIPISREIAELFTYQFKKKIINTIKEEITREWKKQNS